jgi:cytochrome c oxidase subunit 1
MATIAATKRKRGPIVSPRLLEWITTVDHKKIGIMYVLTSFAFFVVGVFLGEMLRLELAQPGGQIVTAAGYNEIFTLHGTTMIFLFIIPVGAGLANYLVPLMIGARDMAFPRLNALSYWLFLFGGVTLYTSFFAKGGPPSDGWTSYPPLSLKEYSPGYGIDFWLLGLTMVGTSSIIGAINLLVTIARLRAPSMSLMKMPLFIWSIIGMAGMILFATPILTSGFGMLLADRNLGTQFFKAEGGGDPVLWQHYFWFYSHPAVYIMVLPAMGVISEILPVFSGKPIFGYKAIAFSSLAIAFLGFGTWAHHMFSVGLPNFMETAFVFTTMIIAVPTGVKMFNWLFTLVGGSLRFTTPMLYSLGFLASFVIGGITGVFQAIVPIDEQVTDTMWIVAHLHYVVFGGAAFGIFGGMYFWWPKMFGYMLNERLGKIQFWTLFVGFHITYFPMHIMGLVGMPRRIFDYPERNGLPEMNFLSTIGAFIMGVSVIVWLYNMISSARNHEPAGNDPWEGNTLEWTTTSPPPAYNFAVIPEVHSYRPARDLRLEIESKRGLPLGVTNEE